MAVPRNMDLDGTRVTDLAARASMTKQSMADLVEQCEHMGLVERKSDPTDQRAKMVLFTRKGRRLMEVIRQSVAIMEREMRSQIGEILIKQIRTGLLIYQDATDQDQPLADFKELGFLADLEAILKMRFSALQNREFGSFI